MTSDDVDAFVAARPKTIDALPEWREGNRAGERRCSLPIEVQGTSSPVSLEMTVQLTDPDYLMALLLVKKRVICRLCMTTGHFDRATGVAIEEAHFHRWATNRPVGPALPKKLKVCETLPTEIVGRGEALSWFLGENGIDEPEWLPGGWPRREALL